MQNKPHENFVYGTVAGLLIVGIIAKLIHPRPKKATAVTSKAILRPYLIPGVGRA